MKSYKSKCFEMEAIKWDGTIESTQNILREVPNCYYRSEFVNGVHWQRIHFYSAGNEYIINPDEWILKLPGAYGYFPMSNEIFTKMFEV